jgi:hypothetical protein
MDEHTEAPPDTILPHPHPLPAWALWSLWVVVVAVVVVALAEYPKQRWFKPLLAWRVARSTAAKARLMAPLLMLIGAAVGAPTFIAAGMLDSVWLAAALGAGVGIMSAPLYDMASLLIGLVPRIVKRQAGIETTMNIAPVPVVGDTVDVPTVDQP